MLARFKDMDLVYGLSRILTLSNQALIHLCVTGVAEITLMVPAFESVMNIVPAEFTSISIPVMGLTTDVPAGRSHLVMNLPSFVNSCMRWLPVSTTYTLP